MGRDPVTIWALTAINHWLREAQELWTMLKEPEFSAEACHRYSHSRCSCWYNFIGALKVIEWIWRKRVLYGFVVADFKDVLILRFSTKTRMGISLAFLYHRISGLTQSSSLKVLGPSPIFGHIQILCTFDFIPIQISISKYYIPSLH